MTLDDGAERTVMLWTLFLMTLVGSLVMLAADDAQATDKSTFNDTGSTFWPALWQYAGDYDFVHSKDGYITVPYVDGDGDLMVAYKEPGGAWAYAEVAPYNYAGNTGPWNCWGALSTSNGSICIAGSVVETATYYSRVYLFTKFPANGWDDWDGEKIMDGAWHYMGDFAINDTDQILLVARMGGSSPYALVEEVFDFPSYTLGHAVGVGHTWQSTTQQVIQVQANSTGTFHIFWQANDNYRYYRDYDKTFAATKIATSTGFNCYDVTFMPNDLWFATGVASSRVYNCYQSSFESSGTLIQASTVFGTWRGVTVSRAGGNNTNYGVYVIGFLNGDQGYAYSAAWNGTAVSWQNSETEADITTAGSYVWMSGSCKQLWPKDGDGRLWGMPKVGWLVVGVDNVGAPYDWNLYTNGSTWWPDLTTDPPQIDTVALPSTTIGEFWSYTLSAVDGTLPYEWNLQAAPAWMSLGASNGTLYGTPTATGTFAVQVRLADAIPRYDYGSWNLVVVPQTSEDTTEGEDWNIEVPDVIGPLWLFFFIFCVFIALFGHARDLTEGGGET